MRASPAPRAAQDVQLHGELRYGWELVRLATDPLFLRPRRRANGPPVLLVPGFLAGDQSLATMGTWLRRRGSRTAATGMWFNVDCGERAVRAIESRLHRLEERAGRRVVVIGQSRGGELARVLAVRNPASVSTLVMLGSPVLEPLNVGPAVLGAVRYVARLGDLGMPGLFSSDCADGPCCKSYWEDLSAPLPSAVRGVSVYSRTDGIVSWRACLDPWAQHVEVDSSHSGMSVNRSVYRVLDGILDEDEDKHKEDR
jgi:triacylglycerol lipase